MDLNSLRLQRLKIESLHEKIERFRSAMESCTQKLSDMPGSGQTRNKLEEDIARLDELEREMRALLISYGASISEAEAALKVLPEQQQIVMWLRYVDGYSWKKVARKSHYSSGHCRNINMVALKNLNS